MRKRVRSRSALFLLELMVSMLFFALTAVVCVQAFVKAHQMSRQANDLNMAVSCASEAAEILNHLDKEETLSDKMPECQLMEEGIYQAWYDENWQNMSSKTTLEMAAETKAEMAYARMEVTVVKENGLQVGKIAVYLCGEEKLIYELETGQYQM